MCIGGVAMSKRVNQEHAGARAFYFVTSEIRILQKRVLSLMSPHSVAMHAQNCQVRQLQWRVLRTCTGLY